jgi:hypothetical protein
LDEERAVHPKSPVVIKEYRPRHMDVPAAAGGERRGKSHAFFPLRPQREWQDARVAVS